MSLTVAGAGMAGLVAATRLRELGRPAVVREKGTRVGGSLLLSSGVVWRHQTFEDFRADCPDGDPLLQRAIVDGFDAALAWLRAKVAPTAEETGNPRTVGARWEPRALVAALADGLDVRLQAPLREIDGPTVLATGGFAAALARERGLPLRAAPWSTGDGIEAGLLVGAAERGDRAEFYGRVLPAPPAQVGEEDFVRAGQLYGTVAHVVDRNGTQIGPEEPAWHEVDLAQAVADAGQAWYVVDAAGAAAHVRGRPVAEMIAVAEALGGEVRRSAELGGLQLGALASPKLERGPYSAVLVATGVTTSYAGLAIDAGARALADDGSPTPGLWACGADAGDIFSGGYASGLAAALVLGLAAAETAAREA